MNDSRRPVLKEMTVRILNIQLAIGLVLLLVGLPFHLVIKQSIPGPIGTYWKEGLLGVLTLLWLIQCIVERRLLLTGTALDGAVLAYLGLLLFRFASDSFGAFAAGTGRASAQIPLWGLYISVLYLPLYWLIPTAWRTARRPLFLRASEVPEHRPEHRAVGWLLLLLVGVGGVLALGGLAEFILDVPLWPSEEIRQRLGHSDFYIYGSHVRRVYFTLDSPTILANTLAMLLPLGITLALAPVSVDWQTAARRWRWLRIASGTASLLMAACIVVTFSRGIWVTATLSLIGMVLLGGLARRLFVHRRWRTIAITVAVVIVAGLAWAALLKVRANTAARPAVGVMELSPAAYAAVPVVEIRQQLLEESPVYGEAVTQTWTLLDPITGALETKTVLYEHPPEQGKAEIIYRVQVPPIADRGSASLRPALRFSVAVDPQVWSPDKGDGTSFQIHVTDIGDSDELSPLDQGLFAFVRHLNPKHNPSDRRWRNFVLDLSPWAGRTIHLALITEAGPAGDWGYDWGGWAHLQVVSMRPGLFEDTIGDQENTIARHARSILDWARDETNRDRLAAWSLSLSAWRAAPLWGQGLGTTGAAALRTQPERAFVTESQVLKSLVELGLPGLLALAYLWFQIARTGYRAYRRAAGDTRMLVLGILTSLTIVFLEGWVYQNLEGKQVNAYFWALTGLLGFLAARGTTPTREPDSDS